MRRLLALALVVMVAGCGEPRLEPSEETGRLLMRAHTAVFGERLELVEPIVRDVEQMKSEGKLSPAGGERLAEILGLAREGKWKEAKDALEAFENGQ